MFSGHKIWMYCPEGRKDLQMLAIIYANIKLEVTITIQHIFSKLDWLRYEKKKEKKREKKSCIILSDLRERQDHNRLYFSQCEGWEELHTIVPYFLKFKEAEKRSVVKIWKWMSKVSLFSRNIRHWTYDLLVEVDL